ncbi:trypsin-like peptidase domain-containing protein [bacterium]|nr:trypsin-like peptidase domain-containing protein [Mariniblastus sp.]MDA7910245.1 trypsin-like peptidase domain-containing protein [bacterium]
MIKQHIGMRFVFPWLVCILIAPCCQLVADDDLSLQDRQRVAAIERYRIHAINRVIQSVVAIYDEDRQGGGSGVIIDPSGIVLTNHHVIMGAGVKGWGGLADGQLYRWKLIGTDPGGDLAIIQLEGKAVFPATPLGDSDAVKVGDWALAMGNPFILTEDQVPTVTLGIVSGVKRYQPGAGQNQLVYGNCIQVDSSINPGNSGGPLFNFKGEVIGINGRGSFKERGRVNVGLGYAISANQIKNFIPDLLATKLVEHATLDASFSDRGGKVVCSQLNRDAPVASAGLDLGDELLEFEGEKVKNANQFTNLICTLPEDWPAELLIRKRDGTERQIIVRTFGLPYAKPRLRGGQGGKDEKDPEKKKQLERQREMIALLSANPGDIRHPEINRGYARRILDEWKASIRTDSSVGVAKLTGEILEGGNGRGTQETWLASDGRIRVNQVMDDQEVVYQYDGDSFWVTESGKTTELTLGEAQARWGFGEALMMGSVFRQKPLELFGKVLIDGSDKAMGENAYRFKVVPPQGDTVYCWFAMYDVNGKPKVSLVKSSLERDCLVGGGSTFSSWTQVGPVQLPLKRQRIMGLDESVKLQVVDSDFEWLEDVGDEFFLANNKKK